MKFPQLGPVSRPQRPHSPAGWLWGGAQGTFPQTLGARDPTSSPGSGSSKRGPGSGSAAGFGPTGAPPAPGATPLLSKSRCSAGRKCESRSTGVGERTAPGGAGRGAAPSPAPSPEPGQSTAMGGNRQPPRAPPGARAATRFLGRIGAAPPHPEKLLFQDKMRVLIRNCR